MGEQKAQGEYISTLEWPMPSPSEHIKNGEGCLLRNISKDIEWGK